MPDITAATICDCSADDEFCERCLPTTVDSTERQWTAMLYDTVSWHPVGTTGDRQHAINEARDWLRDGIRPGERICIAHRDVGPWWPEKVAS